MSAWLLLLILAPAGAAPLSYEQAQTEALAANPSVRTAERQFEQAGYDVRSAHGAFDPTLSLDGGWNQSTNLAFLPFVDDLVLSRNERWNTSARLAATAPTGTSGFLSGTLYGNAQDYLFDDGALPPGFSLTDLQQRSTGHDFTLGLTQELLRGIRLGTNLQTVRQAGEGRSIAELQLERARQQMLKQVAEAYWTWVYQTRLSEISADAVTIAAEDLRIGSARVEAGEAAPVERTRLEAALVQARSNAIDADNGARQARDTLLLLLGREPGADIEPTSDPGEVPILSLEPAKVADVAAVESLDLRIARLQLDASQFNLADARHAVLPSLSASIEAGLSGASDNLASAFELNETMFPNVGVSGAFNMPLGNRVAVARSRRAAVDVVEQRAAVQELERQIRAQVEHQVRLMGSARQKVELADANLRLAIETLAAEESLYEAGRSLLKDVLEARSSLDRARADAAKARTDFRVAQAELLRLQGRLEVGG